MLVDNFAGLTSIIYKVTVITAVVALMFATLNQLPEAKPLPDGVSEGINWFLSTLFFFNDILDVPTLMICVYYGIYSFLAYLTIRFMLLTVRWATSSS